MTTLVFRKYELINLDFTIINIINLKHKINAKNAKNQENINEFAKYGKLRIRIFEYLQLFFCKNRLLILISKNTTFFSL